MFVRKKKNRSGTTTIVVVNKRHGKFEEVRNFGTAKTESEVSELYSKAQHWLNTNGGQQSIDFEDLKGRELEATDRFFDNIDSVLINGTQLLLGQIYDSIGFNRTGDEILRHLVIARVSQPMSKLATVEYLKSYYDEDVDLNHIYRYMDRLYKTQQEQVQQISVEHTKKILGGRIGLMSEDNVKLLRSAGYKYIIGARIKSEKKAVKDWILSHEKKDGCYFERKRSEGERLIVGYSETRAKKDAYNRNRGVARLRKAYSSGRLTKAQVNRRGYNKFLEISKDIQVSISEDKISEDEKWGGLKGYITNTSLDAERIVAQYHGLWVVERAFRISKGTLDMRPMFHFTERRIEAHVCICFIAYKVYKELERIIKLAGIKMSVGDVIKAARTITTIRVRLPENREILTKTLFLTERHKAIEPLFKLSTLNLE